MNQIQTVNNLRKQCSHCDNIKNCFRYDSEGYPIGKVGCSIGEKCRIVGGALDNCLNEDIDNGIVKEDVCPWCLPGMQRSVKINVKTRTDSRNYKRDSGFMWFNIHH